MLNKFSQLSGSCVWKKRPTPWQQISSKSPWGKAGWFFGIKDRYKVGAEPNGKQPPTKIMYSLSNSESRTTFTLTASMNFKDTPTHFITGVNFFSLSGFPIGYR